MWSTTRVTVRAIATVMLLGGTPLMATAGPPQEVEQDLEFLYGDVDEDVLLFAGRSPVRNAADAGVTNVEFLEGYLEDVPLPDASVDVVISNCVINLAADKRVALAEAFRVLRPGGRLAISDVVALAPWTDELRADVESWTGCIAGALLESDDRRVLGDVGFHDVQIERTHQVHDLAAAAVVRATRPA
ncbi:methyltransferase domain-containing protein [Serinicoccus sp. CUA-874]|uniref:methyltransferase domain-containing protein n=1 Tax=Serinicoccus sp. CUA-874 TaxID=1517939 RepID=UPI0009F929EA|nr:methyltransferase domain-containing protein [Serinicoccus sp. CUA-874]